MCGIAGFLKYPKFSANTDLQSLVLNMQNCISHRGPDGSGIWISDSRECAFGHRRLSIIDLSRNGAQPISDDQKKTWVTFNGEIYNYQKIRKELIDKGHTLISKTDSEVLPYLFKDASPKNLSQLDGMYAFAVWSEINKKLVLARDPFGKKPLYYTEGVDWFAFASELQALRVLPGFDSSIDQDALSMYLLTGYVPAPDTIFCGTKKLLPGHYLELEQRSADRPKIKISQHSDFCPKEPAMTFGGYSRYSRLEELRKLTIHAVEKRLVSDVPLGAFLSGGVDSSLVAAIATKELGRKLKTFTIGFEGSDESEHLAAREIASRLGTEHHEKILKPDAISLIDEIAGRLDEPNGDSSCLPTLLLARHAKEYVTVALSGDGGDELFGGYGRYRDTLKEFGSYRQRLKRWLGFGKPWSASSAYLSPRWLIFQPSQIEKLTGPLSDVVAKTLTSWRTTLENRSMPLIHRMRYLDAHTYLPGAVLAKVDRMSMQVALEVRCPLLDSGIRRFAENLSSKECWKPPAQTKRLLKRLASDYLPEKWMQRPKMGFGLPPNVWSRSAMLKMATDNLCGTKSVLGKLVDRNSLCKLIASQGITGGFSVYQVWPLLVLEAWLKKNFK
jgi:asparagine synthase (glutamine-hydrolysing)